jgi:small subunit ribosomal protein S9
MQIAQPDTSQVKGVNYIWATGRRKTAVARVRIRHGTGKIEVNYRPLEQYFTTLQDRVTVLRPLKVTESMDKYDIYINASGGGISGQAGAAQLGIARALRIIDPELESKLRHEGLFTRDPRMKERKKYGLRGARRRPQYSKR